MSIHSLEKRRPTQFISATSKLDVIPVAWTGRLDWQTCSEAYSMACEDTPHLLLTFCSPQVGLSPFSSLSLSLLAFLAKGYTLRRASCLVTVASTQSCGLPPISVAAGWRWVMGHRPCHARTGFSPPARMSSMMAPRCVKLTFSLQVPHGYPLTEL